VPIQPDQTLLHYRIVDKLGEGGMGIVWRAVDTTLDREVAIKLLPTAVGDDPERLARFDREAKLLASLNHPNIAGIYGAHEVDGTRFLAMELVEGEELAERLARGPIPVEETIELAREIASALEAAHEAGVIHRDLKPANVKLTPEGQVKVLDFGLAKALAPETASGSVDLAASPTLTTGGTVAGTILGTAAYMSPEQAKGKAVDRRADVWSFGCVLYECLTGRAAFQGASVSEILAEVLKSEPDWAALPPSTPPAVRRLLRRCLVKDPRERLRDLGDARLELSDSDPEAPADVAGSAPASRPSRTSALAGWITAAALLLALLVVLFATRKPDTTPTTVVAPPLHAEIGLPEDAELGFGLADLGVDSNLLALSPDGTLLVYVGRSPGGGSQLYRRELTGFDPPAAIPGTEGAYHAFFSPDGDSIGFLTVDKLKRVAPNGDGLLTIAPITTVLRGQWTADDTIYLGAVQGRTLQRVPAGGGRPQDLHSDRDMVFLEVLPHGRSALVMLREGISTDYADIALLDLETFETTTIVESGYDAHLLTSDRIVFARGGSLLAVPFDAGEGRVTGEAVTVMREVVMDAVIGQAQFTFSDSGTMVFVRGPEQSRGGVARIDRDGNQEFLPIEQGTYGVLDLDPTDQKLAIHVADVESYVWTYDIPSGRGTRLPGRQTGWPKWSNDGESIAYNDDSDGTLRIVPVAGSAAGRPAIPNEWSADVSSWSPDDRVLAINDKAQGGVSQLAFLDLEDGTVAWVDGEGSYRWGAAFSPDGKWVAYSSNETGAWEVWIRSYPDGSVVRQISDGGGIETVWSPSGEIFYRLGDRWMSVAITTEPTLNWSAPRQVFETDFIDTMGRSYDVSSDGQSLYVVKQPAPPDGTRVHVVTGWVP
jgi:serine/threonine-protein kinase